MNTADYLPIPCSQDAIYETIASVNRFTRSGVNRFNAMPTCVKVAAIAIPLIWALGAALNIIYGEDDQEPGIFSYFSQLFNYGGLTKKQVDDFWRALENEGDSYTIIPEWDFDAVIRAKTLPAALNRAWGENFLQYRDLVLKVCDTSGNDNACGLFCINGQKINGCYQYPGKTPGASIRQDFAKDFWARIDDPKVFSKFCDVIGQLYKDFNHPQYIDQEHVGPATKVMEPIKENEAYKTYQKHVMDSPSAKEQARIDFFKSLYENRSSFRDDFIDKINQGRYGNALSKTPDADKENFLKAKRSEITHCDNQKRFTAWMVNDISSLADECIEEGIEVNGISWPKYKQDFLNLQKKLLKSDENALEQFALNKEVQQSYCNMIQESNYRLTDIDVQFAAAVFRKRVYFITDNGVHPPFGDTEGEEVFVHNNGSNHYSRCEPTQRMEELMSTHDDSSDETSSQGSLNDSPPGSTGSSPVVERRDDSTAPIVNIDIESLRQNLQSVQTVAIIEEDKTEADKTCSLHALYGDLVDSKGKTSNGVQVISKDTGQPVIGPILVYPDGGAKGARDRAVDLLREGIAKNDEVKKMYVEDFALWIQAMKGGDVIADNMLGSATTASRVIDLQTANEEALNQQRNARNSISAIIYRQQEQLPEYAKQLLIASSGKGSQEEFEEAINDPENGIGVFGNWFNQCKNNIIEALKNDGRWSDTLKEIEGLQDCIDKCAAKQDQQLKELALEQRIIEKYLTHAINHVDVELNNTQLKMLALASGIHLILIQKEGSDFSVSEVGKSNPIQRIVYLRSGHYTRAHLNEKYAENLNQDGVYNTLFVPEEEEE